MYTEPHLRFIMTWNLVCKWTYQKLHILEAVKLDVEMLINLFQIEQMARNTVAL